MSDNAWDDDRIAELKTFQELLIECQTINRGSRALERIADCIEMATALHTSDLSSGRQSFVQFLNGIALEWREANKGPK